jgi:uncharacterized membrane protein YeaQ/YmgE (transglycosylase-associated protein family)
MTTLELIILTAAMVVMGLIIGWIAGLIWKDNRPMGVRGDYILAVVLCVVFGFVEWFLIPALGFDDWVKYLGVFVEVPAIALIGLWLVRVAKRD